MKEYLDLVQHVLENGVIKSNRTGIDTLSCFACFYKVDLSKGYPLLTTKKVRFKSMLEELLWYLSGVEHIRNLRQKTKIWDAWADQEGRLESAYGRFWRRFPVPESGLDGENWGKKWIKTESATGVKVFDQIQFVVDTLKEIKDNPRTHNLRRMVVTAWHPANAAESKLPPCHYTFCFNVLNGKLNCHLTQRSADIALGVPFNLACYSLLCKILAMDTGFEVGEFAHTLIDAHIYVNHIDNLKLQLQREPRPLPTIKIDKAPIHQLTAANFQLQNYNPYPAIKFEVAV
ncbi:thymidylate synthase [Candidatus Riflebacteria bacterium]